MYEESVFYFAKIIKKTQSVADGTSNRPSTAQQSQPLHISPDRWSSSRWIYRNTNKCEYLVEIENDVNGVWPQSNIDPDLVTTSTLPMYSPPLQAAPSEDIFIYIVDIVNITNVHKYFQLSDQVTISTASMYSPPSEDIYIQRCKYL